MIALQLVAAVASCTPAAHYDYSHLPSGYHWRAVYDFTTSNVVFYGRDPLTNDTVYVGPDNRFYIFAHSGTIRVKDLSQRWTPHDAR
ncbi:MAG TPA: hypothetical protein VFE35_02355 [Candidatus Cybelea sp.]|nr:hypothetical protein [Candidatus Cybelea sp.]